MNEKDILYGSEEYKSLSKAKIHVSGAPVLLGLDSYRKPKEEIRKLVREFHNAEIEEVDNVAIDHQRLWELSARNQLQNLIGSTINHAYTYFKDGLVANPNGYVKKRDGGIVNVRIRCPFHMRNAFDEQKDFDPIMELPSHYARIQLEMYCMGAEKTYFFQWSERKYLFEEVEYNSKWVEATLRKLAKINDEIFGEKGEIKNEAHLAPLRAEVKDGFLIEIIERLDVLEGEKKQLDQLINDEKDKIIKYAEDNGGHDLEIAGRKITKVTTKGSVKWAEVAKAKLKKEDLTDAELDQFRSPSRSHWRIS